MHPTLSHALLAAVLVLGSCSGSTDPTVAPPTVPTSVGPPSTTTASISTTTASTSTSPPPTPCVVTEPELSTESGRRVTLRAAGLAGPSPTILVFHGYTGTPGGIERVADLTATANAAGVAVAYPEGTPTPVGGLGWDTGARVFANTGVDDVVAIDEMLAVLEATGCVDPERVMIAGESNGGGMTLATLCDPRLAGRFRSAVMVVPAVDDGVVERCGTDIDPTTTLVAVVGRIDQLAVFDGGNGLLPQLDWFERVALSRGCTSLGTAAAITEFADRYAATGCDACTELIAVADGPHTWPGSSESNGDLVPGTFDLNRRIIDDILAPDSSCLSER